MMLYPNDWEGDEVAFCSLAAQGLWLRMMFLMHRSTRYGYLSLPNGSAIPQHVIAAKCGITPEAYCTLLEELDNVGKLARTSDGVIYSRRMVRDAQQRAKARGKMSDWRKSKKVKNNCNDSVTTPVTPVLPLSSSSISSSNTVPSAIGPEMIARSVLSECGLSGRDLAIVLEDVCKSQMKLYATPGELRDALIAAWRKYDSAKPNLQYSKGTAKFFGDGDWRNPKGWPWNPNTGPTDTKPMTAAEKMRRIA